jgi:hypothetical protein
MYCRILVSKSGDPGTDTGINGLTTLCTVTLLALVTGVAAVAGIVDQFLSFLLPMELVSLPLLLRR